MAAQVYWYKMLAFRNLLQSKHVRDPPTLNYLFAVFYDAVGGLQNLLMFLQYPNIFKKSVLALKLKLSLRLLLLQSKELVSVGRVFLPQLLDMWPVFQGLTCPLLAFLVNSPNAFSFIVQLPLFNIESMRLLLLKWLTHFLFDFCSFSLCCVQSFFKPHNYFICLRPSLLLHLVSVFFNYTEALIQSMFASKTYAAQMFRWSFVTTADVFINQLQTTHHACELIVAQTRAVESRLVLLRITALFLLKNSFGFLTLCLFSF